MMEVTKGHSSRRVLTKAAEALKEGESVTTITIHCVKSAFVRMTRSLRTPFLVFRSKTGASVFDRLAKLSTTFLIFSKVSGTILHPRVGTTSWLFLRFNPRKTAPSTLWKVYSILFLNPYGFEGMTSDRKGVISSFPIRRNCSRMISFFADS